MSTKTVQLQDVVEDIYDGPHATPTKTDEGPCFLGISSLVDGRLDLTKSAHLSEEDFTKWTRRVTPTHGDLVFSYETRLGEAALIPPDLRCCLGRRMGLLRPDREVVDPRYLLYVYLGPEFQATLRAHSVHGSTVNRLLLTEMPDYPITIHKNLEEQRRIAAILGALDDKIELNRKMNRTLEEIAQTLFQAWFVDFEGETDLVESEELGMIPRGWGVGPIGELVNAVGGGTPSTKNPKYWDGGETHWTTPRDLSSLHSPILLDTARKITEAGLEKVSSGLLPVGTVLMSSRAPVGYTAIAQVPVAVNQGYIAIPPGGELNQLYVFFWLRANMGRIKKRAGGTTFQEISKRNFRPMPAIAPPAEIQDRFDQVAEPMFERIVCNERESQILAEIRDTLLPKLISGEIRVPEAEDLVEEAV